MKIMEVLIENSGTDLFDDISLAIKRMDELMTKNEAVDREHALTIVAGEVAAKLQIEPQIVKDAIEDRIFYNKHSLPN